MLHRRKKTAKFYYIISMKWLNSVTHKHVTAEHYLENNKYMIWYYKEKDPYKTIGFVQVRGLKEPLTKEELVLHIDKLWEEFHKMQNNSQKTDPITT